MHGFWRPVHVALARAFACTLVDLKASDADLSVVVLGRVVGAGNHAAVGVRGPTHEADGLGTTVEP